MAVRTFRRIVATSTLAAITVVTTAAAGSAASPAPAGSPTDNRVGVVLTSGVALVKQGSLNAPWTQVGAHVTQLAMSGNRMVELTAAGRAYVKQGPLRARWHLLWPSALQVAVSGRSIGVVTSAHVAMVKTGAISAPWQLKLTGIRSLVLADSRVGVLRRNGTVTVRDGLQGSALRQSGNAIRLAMAGTRIGIVDTKQQVGVKQGRLYALFVHETRQQQPAHAVALTTSRVGIVTDSGLALVKAPKLAGPWTTESSKVHAAQLALWQQRIAIVQVDGVALIKQGGLTSAYVQLHTGVASVVLPNG